MAGSLRDDNMSDKAEDAELENIRRFVGRPYTWNNSGFIPCTVWTMFSLGAMEETE